MDNCVRKPGPSLTRDRRSCHHHSPPEPLDASERDSRALRNLPAGMPLAVETSTHASSSAVHPVFRVPATVAG
jgi:hypothetical protein